MSPSLRFLGVALFAWTGVRAIALGLVPGTHVAGTPAALVAAPSEPSLPPIEPTLFPPISPVDPPRFDPVPKPAPVLSESTPVVHADPPRQAEEALGEPFIPEIARVAEARPVPAEPPIFHPAPGTRASSRSSLADRLSVSSWAMIRKANVPASLSNAPTLGGSQVGARLLWRFDPRVAASLRMSAPVGGVRGGEAAVGIRLQPAPALPFAMTLERRQAFGSGGGTTGFAAFAEAGIARGSLPLGLSLDAWLQAGAVGARRRDWFVDGSAAVTRPVWRNVSIGAGTWGGAQPRLSRLDAGPRLSMEVRPGVRVHGDYRVKLLGNAAPGSGGVVTLAADF